MPDGPTALLWLTVAVALGFDFTNGFHDTANAVATTIGTRALPARLAIIFSALLNLTGAVVATQVLHSKVANTIGGLVVVKAGVALPFICAALVGAIAWNLITWRAGLPSSSSHALIGGLVGMGVAAYGVGAINIDKVIPTVIALVTSPVAGLVCAYLLMVVLANVLRGVHPGPANRAFRRLQILSSAFVSFSHGANDSQKTMAVITLALVSTHHLSGFDVPFWVVLAAAGAIGMGTYAGGWRIIRTMGSRIIRLEPINGFVAETVGASIIQLATQVSLPVSTTHVVSGAVMGSGAPRGLSAVRWGVARNIALAWVFTIPMSALVAAGLTLLIRAVFGPLG
ncbi:MAG: inorganic phosphate transporter, PiT family [Chloroflexota bacterium]|jgi:PiT family inorganic phosphate transporter|nr:inorganic phosphate transporter, PiT family [Chloroflexota bacterium]